MRNQSGNLSAWAAPWRRSAALARVGRGLGNCARLVPWLLICLLVTGSVLAQTGGGYDLTWNSVDGGGQTSTGDGYTLSGTAGQPDAGLLTGGGHTLSGGLWSGAEVVAPVAYHAYLPMVLRAYRPLYIILGETNQAHGIRQNHGGDKDTEVVLAGDPPLEGRRMGNGRALQSPDGNDVPDHFMQFNVDDDAILAGEPTTHVVVEIEYLDEGTDQFGLQYDAVDTVTPGDGKFKEAGWYTKTGTGKWRTMRFVLEDAFFGDRDQDADFRLDDASDGADTIRRVAVMLLAQSQASEEVPR